MLSIAESIVWRTRLSRRYCFSSVWNLIWTVLVTPDRAPLFGFGSARTALAGRWNFCGRFRRIIHRRQPNDLSGSRVFYL